ncbi:MAG: hypothetical protein GAK28_04071 [Luteibacter sp.]|uniref:hypothetical protein n=1 Tax=Luteibacter sp. TaxID=1886636 RepID=UPI00137E8B0A|nr:hypothetical protein [Luteibacter sp.]KAF1004364.1 MAG: hypothetical protein GAK28_04071 [Luteibacter sp.]
MLASDFEEARFRAHLVASLAEDLGLSPIVDAARDVELRLGRLGQEPLAGYGAAIARLSEAIRPELFY